MCEAADEKLTKSLIKGFHEQQTTEAVIAALDRRSASAGWDGHLRRASASMILSVVYGHPTITSEQDLTVALINDFAKRVTSAARPGAHWVEPFPWMRYIPSRWALCRSLQDTDKEAIV